MAEEKTHNWTTDETRALIEWRTANDSLFTGKRNTSKTGWEGFVATSGLKISSKQAKKKWHNLVQKYKDLRDPPGLEAGAAAATTWQWYDMLDAALQGQHSINPPVVVASSMSATTGGVVAAPASATERRETREQPREGRKRSGGRELLDFLKEQSEREEQREREMLARAEERENEAARRADSFLTLFGKLVDKF